MAKQFYYGDVRARPVSDMRDPERLGFRAKILKRLRKSGDATIDWMCDEIYLHHLGRKFGPRGQEIHYRDIDIVQLFGKDPRRWINAFKKRADGKHTQLLHRDHVPRIMCIDFATDIYCGRNGITL